jgi:hypothetical protein
VLGGILFTYMENNVKPSRNNVALSDLIRKCTPRQVTYQTAAAYKHEMLRRQQEKVGWNENKNSSSISLQITAVFVWKTKGWKNEETGNVSNGEQFSFICKLSVCSTVYTAGHSQ